MNIINFASVDLPNFINKKVNNTNIISFGSDNKFGEYLIELYNSSALHNAIIENKSKILAGKSVKIKNLETYSILEKTIINNIIENNISCDCNLDEVIRRISKDYTLFSAFALEIIYNKTRDKIAEINHIDISKIRIGEMVNGKVLNYYYCQDWSNRKHKPIQISAYNTNNKHKDNSQLLYVKEYRTGCDYYSLPNYIGALNWIKIDAEISKFQLSNIQNGFAPTVAINYNSILPIEQMDVINKQLNQKYSGAHNAGKLLLTFSDGKDKAPEYKVLETSNMDTKFLQLSNSIQQNILSAHQITSPMLVGIKTEGQLGGSNELEQAYKMLENNIKKSRLLIEQSLNKLLKNFVTPFQIEIESDTLDITFSEATLLAILTQNELRAKIGYEAIEPTEIKNNEIKN